MIYPSFHGGWRAEKRKILMARALRHAGAFRRANKRSSSEAIAHQKKRDRSLPKRACSFASVFRHWALLSSGPSRKRIAPTEPSASSWQGLLVAPEGAPMPPECLVATRPAGAAPRPASRRLMKRPLEGRGGWIVSEVRQSGVMGA